MRLVTGIGEDRFCWEMDGHYAVDSALAYAARIEKASIFEFVVILKAENLTIDESARIDSHAKLECGEGLIIGKHVHLASHTHILGGGRAILEDGASMGSGSKIINGSNVPGYSHGCSAIAPDARFERGLVVMKKNSTLFANAVVLPGCVIGEGACVAAGAVVLPNTVVGDHELWAGVPAVFKRKILPDADPLNHLVAPMTMVKESPEEIEKRWIESQEEWYS